MPRGFSFQNDIAPMRGSFFQSGLSSREGSYLAKKYGPQMEDVKDMLSIQSQMAAIRNSDMAYQTNLENLQNQRDKAQRQRDLDSRLPSLISQIQDIQGSDEDPTTKAKNIANLQIQNPYLSSTTLGSQLIGAATYGINAEDKARIKQENKEKAERAKYMTRLKPYVDTGAVDKVQGMIDADEVRDQDEIDALNLASYNLERAEAGAQKTLTSERTADFFNTQKSLVAKGYAALDNLTYATGAQAGFDKEGKMIKPTTEQGEAPVLTPESRREMERILARLNKTSLKKVRDKKLADDQLQDDLYEATYKLEADLEATKFAPTIKTDTKKEPASSTTSQWVE